MNLALKQIGLTDEQDNAVIILLTAWGIRDQKTSDYGTLCSLTGQITQSPMHRYKKDVTQEQADSTNAPYIQPYSNEALDYVRDIINALPDIRHNGKKIKKCLIAKYRWRDDKNAPADKIIMVKMPSRTYYDRIRQGHEIVWRKMDWRLI